MYVYEWNGKYWNVKEINCVWETRWCRRWRIFSFSWNDREIGSSHCRLVAQIAAFVLWLTTKLKFFSCRFVHALLCIVYIGQMLCACIWGSIHIVWLNMILDIQLRQSDSLRPAPSIIIVSHTIRMLARFFSTALQCVCFERNLFSPFLSR